MAFNLEKIKEVLSDKFSLSTLKGKIENLSVEEVLKELQLNHNHSWYQELYERNKNWLDDIAIFYRGNNVTYREMFEKMQSYAKSLRENGIVKGTEIPICMSNTPELVYLLGAISIVGAKANIFSNEFDREYICEIVDGCDSNIIFAEDNLYSELEELIPKTHIKKIVMTSLTDSLPNGKNPYYEYDKKHGLFVNNVIKYKSRNNLIIDIDQFEKEGTNYSDIIENTSDLDDEFTITYSSGSTNSTRPKAIVHTVRSFITIGRCHDPEIQKTTSMKNFTIQAHIPTHSNTDIISSISDSLMQGSKLALEPIYDKDFFVDSLIINDPSYVVATRSFWINTMKKVFYDEEYKNVKFPSLLIPFSVGEPLEANEEKFLNKGLRKTKAGTGVIKIPVSPITMSVAGGDCEHGGIFWTLFRAIQSKKPNNLLHGHVQGLKPFEMVEVAILDEDGKKCGPYEIGRLVANSPCNMKMYKNNLEATNKFFIKDADGKVWGDCSVYSFIDNYGGIHMKGRMPENKEDIPNFVIADAILKDTKNIMSCEVVKDEDDDMYIAHIEFQPEKRQSDKNTLVSATQRCEKFLGEEITDKLLFRVHSFEESFPLTGCGKRNNKALIAEGITDKCIKTDVILDKYLSKNETPKNEKIKVKRYK